MEIVFSDDDLARVRVALTLDPVSEVMAAAHHRSPPGRTAGAGGFRHQRGRQRGCGGFL